MKKGYGHINSLRVTSNDSKLEEEKKIQNFIEKIAMEYFENRNMQAVNEYLEERTSWIGTGKNEFSRNLTEARLALEKESKEYSGAFHISKLKYKMVSLEYTGYVVYGIITAAPEDLLISKENIRFTAIIEETEQGPKLLHLHFSHGDSLQEEGQYFISSSALSDNKMLRLKLDAHHKELENLTKKIPGGVHQCENDPHLTLLSMSDGFLGLFGYTREEIHILFKDQFMNMIHPDDRKAILCRIDEQLKHGKDIELEYRVLCKNKEAIWILDKGRLLKDIDGKSSFYCILIEINDRKREQEALRLSLERHEVIMNQTTDIIFEWDIQKDTLIFSPNWEKKFGYHAIDKNICTQIPSSQNIHPEDIAAFIKIMKDAGSGVPYTETEFRIRNIKGRYLWCRIRATTQYNENKQPIKAIGVIIDIDAEKQENQALMEQAQRDSLTGLYNNKTITILIKKQLQKIKNKELGAILTIDIDHFKSINDTYGHLCGDKILSGIASILKKEIRSTDLAGRTGGDEFLVYLSGIRDKKDIQKKADNLLKAFRALSPKENTSPITCSIGAVVFKKGDNDYLKLYKYADLALYYQKNNGRDGVTLYSPELFEDKN